MLSWQNFHMTIFHWLLCWSGSSIIAHIINSMAISRSETWDHSGFIHEVNSPFMWLVIHISIKLFITSHMIQKCLCKKLVFQIAWIKSRYHCHWCGSCDEIGNVVLCYDELGSVVFKNMATLQCMIVKYIKGWESGLETQNDNSKIDSFIILYILVLY